LLVVIHGDVTKVLLYPEETEQVGLNLPVNLVRAFAEYCTLLYDKYLLIVAPGI
jgi:hypothetical protein